MARRDEVRVAKRGQRSAFGSVRRLPSGRWQARYTGPDGRQHRAPVTFDTKGDAGAWLTLERADVLRGEWRPPESRQAVAGVVEHHGRGPVLFGHYAGSWLASRALRTSTQRHYRRLLDVYLLPAFRSVPVEDVTPATVRAWHAALDTGPTSRAHAYALLRTIMATAVTDELVPSNPCRIRGAGSARRARAIRPATLAELGTIVEHSPERYRLMVLLSSWCGLRFGEVTELRRRDVDTEAGTLRVERAVARAGGGRFVVGEPKSDAGRRTVTVPPHLLPMVRDHLLRYTGRGQDALLFAAADGGHLAPSTVYGWYYPAREAAGRTDLRWHDLRHTGATLAAATGATLAELMHRLGHSTPQAAMIYQHAAADRDRVIAEALSTLASGDVVPLTRVHA